MKKNLTINEQIEKLNYLEKDIQNDEELLHSIAYVLIYNGMVEFIAIQAIRLFEQIILKSQLAQNQKPIFEPHTDEWFYNKQVSTRKILKEIKKFLPLRNENNKEVFIHEINKFLKLGNDFLNIRNSIIHRLGNPKTSLRDIRKNCTILTKIYKDFLVAQKEIFKKLQPYRFSEKEIRHFYQIKS